MNNLEAVVLLYQMLDWLERQGMLRKKGMSKTDILNLFFEK